MLKGALPFRSITRVPFIWSDPASRQGRVSNVLASTIDIPPRLWRVQVSGLTMAFREGTC